MSWVLILLLLGLLAPLGEAQTPMTPPKLEWKYEEPTPPTRFVIKRSLDGGATWHEVASVPGSTGTALTWTDTTLPADQGPLVAHYRTYAVKATEWSAASNPAVTTRGGAPRLPQQSVTLVGVDSPTSATATYKGSNALDGDPDTFWRTGAGTNPPPLPHWILVDLGGILAVDGVAYLPRQDGQTQGTIAQYAVDVSRDGSTWPPPVAEGTWHWETPKEQYARFPATEGRYVRLRALTEVSGGPWTAAAEVGIYAQAAVPVPIQPTGQACTVTQVTATAVTITCPLASPTPTSAPAVAPKRRR
jgi:hypothetical protein